VRAFNVSYVRTFDPNDSTTSKSNNNVSSCLEFAPSFGVIGRMIDEGSGEGSGDDGEAR
jgi:hypothetical protein